MSFAFVLSILLHGLTQLNSDNEKIAIVTNVKTRSIGTVLTINVFLNEKLHLFLNNFV